MPLGSVGFREREQREWRAPDLVGQAVVDRLRSLRGPGESYSDVILALADGR
jgi:hypothetical protein